MKWTREAFSKPTKYTSDCSRYCIVRDRLLSSKVKYTLYYRGDDKRETYLATCFLLDFAKRNAERHAATGNIIGQCGKIGVDPRGD